MTTQNVAYEVLRPALVLLLCDQVGECATLDLSRLPTIILKLGKNLDKPP